MIKWGAISCLWIERIIIVKIFPLLKAIYRFNAVYQSSSDIFHINNIIITNLKCMWNHKRPWITKTILRKGNTKKKFDCFFICSENFHLCDGCIWTLNLSFSTDLLNFKTGWDLKNHLVTNLSSFDRRQSYTFKCLFSFSEHKIKDNGHS